MKTKKKIMSVFLILSILLSLSGCMSVKDASSTTENIQTTQTITEIYYTKEVRSEYSEENYLDFDNSSWLREFKPEFVMVHFMSGVTVDKENPYRQDIIRSIFEDYEIGINYVINRDGTVECLLPENRAAWHAGEGEWNNDPKYTNKMNLYSIGIEVLAIGSEGDMEQYLSDSEYASLNPEYIGYTQEQYKSLNLLIKDICERQDIPYNRQHIIGHEEYSSSKTDPGELFNWSKIGF